MDDRDRDETTHIEITVPVVTTRFLEGIVMVATSACGYGRMGVTWGMWLRGEGREVRGGREVMGT